MACTIQSYTNYSELLDELKECLASEKENQGGEDHHQGKTEDKSVSPKSSSSTSECVSVEQSQKENTEPSLGSSPEDIDLSVSLDTPSTITRTTETMTNQTKSQNERNQGSRSKLSEKVETEGTGTQKKICHFYKTNSCRYHISGKGCKYAHPKPCPKLLKFGLNKEKGCNKGRHCSHYHPRMCYMSLNEGRCHKVKCPYTHLHGTRKVSAEPNENSQHLMHVDSEKSHRKAASNSHRTEVEMQKEPQHFLDHVETQRKLDLLQAQMEQIQRHLAMYQAQTTQVPQVPQQPQARAPMQQTEQTVQQMTWGPQNHCFIPAPVKF